MDAQSSARGETEVVRSACNLCLNFCGILVHKQDGKVVKIEGDPENPHNSGHVCAKGLSGFLSLYSPRRITSPLLRTNPAKGLGVDPKWKKISWEEAIGTVVEKLKKIKVDSSGYYNDKVLYVTFDNWAYYGALSGWLAATKAGGGVWGAESFCGNAVHPPSYLNTATLEIMADTEYAKYILLIGAQQGSVVHYDTMKSARQIAEKRPGSVKVVVVDPVCSYAASKAEEWVPIRPGTDAAFILALVNLLLNEYKMCDTKFLKEKTNAPYLIGSDGLYTRDPVTKKPLVWDSIDRVAKPFDADVKDHALEGEYAVNGVRCEPAFKKVREYVKKYTPEWVSEITSVPAETIRRIAKELGEAASIGATTTIDGVELPYRPVSVVWYRGLSAHRHSFLSGLAAMLLPTILGALQVPGGIRGHPQTTEYVTDDGLLAAGSRSIITTNPPYPPRAVSKPSRFDLSELFPVSVYSHIMTIRVLLDPERYGLDPSRGPELMFVCRDNPVASSFSPAVVVEALKKVPFIVQFAVEPDETTQSVADLVFPDSHYLERLAEGLMFQRGDEGEGWRYAARPVVRPPFEPPYDGLVSTSSIMFEIAKRVGFLGDCYAALNTIWRLKGTQYELDPNSEYSFGELVDRRLKANLGAEKGLDWLVSEEGGLITWKPDIREHYKSPFRKGRIHLYYEFMEGAGKEVDRVTKEMNLRWDTSDYQPIPDWKPCPSYAKHNEEYDLFVVNYKVPILVHGFSRANPILKQLTEHHGLETVLMNTETARRKGINDGDEVLIETIKGKKARAVVRATERVHPEVVATSAHRITRGAEFNELVTLDEETFDHVGCAIDSCLLAKVNAA